MRPRGSFTGWVLWLGATNMAFEARAQGGGTLLVFDASADGLPRAEIRAAVEKELGRPLAPGRDSAAGELTIVVDAGRLVVRYRTANGSVERYLPMPSEPSNVPLIVSLAAGNLVRDQASEIESAEPIDHPEPAPVAASQPPSPPSTATVKRHWLGFHAAQDIALVYDTGVCHHVFGPPVNFSCFYEATDDEPFFHHSDLDQEDFDDGPSFATTRFLLSYDYAIERWVSVGTRLGFAVGGGPAAGQTPDEDPPDGNPNLLPAHTTGSGGTPFLPLHAELRASFWFLPLDGRSLGVYAGAGFGVAQVDSKHTVVVTDCAQTLDPEWNPADGSFEDCMFGTPDANVEAFSRTRLDAWKKMGRGFAALHAGAMLPVHGDLSLVLNVNAMYMFPADGFVLEPSLGAMTSL